MKTLTRTLSIIATAMVGLLFPQGKVMAGPTPVVGEDSTAYYVYSDKFEHGVPSGFMGEKNGSSLKGFNLKYTESPYKGTSCIKITADGTESWAGLYVLYTGKWLSQGADKMTRANLSKYEKLTFYARADKMMTLDGIGMGEQGESAEKLSSVDIGTTWKKYEINIKGMELDKINGLFYFVFSEPGTVYLDEIKYEPAKSK